VRFPSKTVCSGVSRARPTISATVRRLITERV
jgi:hypothetical protein